MKNYNRIICSVLVLILLCNTLVINSMAIDSIQSETKIISEVSLNDNFSDNQVLVLLTNKASLSLKEYYVTDFSEIDCKRVFSLVSSITNAVKDITIESKENTALKQFFDDVNINSYKNIICIELNNPGKENVITAIRKLEQREDVLCACPNYQYTLNNPIITRNNNDSQNYVQWDTIAEFLQLSAIWEAFESGAISFNTEIIDIAVIDSGINHSIFSNQIDWVKSADALNYAGDPTNPDLPTGNHVDYIGHGTHIAGIIGSTIFSDFFSPDLFWINNNFKFISVRVVDAQQNTDLMELIAAVNHMIQLTIPIDDETEIIPPIINFSIGDSFSFNTTSEIQLLYSAIDSYPGLVVCSAGNDSLDIEDGGYYPASWYIDNMITVGSCTLEGEVCDYSNYAESDVDLLSFGEYVYSTNSNHICNQNLCSDYSTHISTGFHSRRGTSFATPFVTGVAALLLSINPQLSAIQLKSIIESTVTTYDSLDGVCKTGGYLNAYAAVDSITDLKSIHNNHNKTYSQRSSAMHNTICLTCDCNYIEEHDQINGTAVGLDGHYATCPKCGYYGLFGHNWVNMGNIYRCNVCQYYSTIIPNPGLNSLSNENDDTIASLPPSKQEEEEI